jgi:uridine kinase
VHLSVLDSGLSTATLAKLFCLSAKKEENGADALSEKIEAVKALVSCGKVTLDFDEFCAKILTWKNDAYPAVHHSDAFKREYAPAYRVIANEYADFLDVFVRIDRIMSEKGGVTLAIDGGSASGKTTLAELISRVYDCNEFHMDDFFLRPEQRTTERLLQIGGNVDKERFAEEVLSPLSKRQTVIYRPFDCSIQALREARKVSPKSINVIEGAYSTHPELGGYYDFSLFLDVDVQCQRERILKRNSPDFARRFFEEWIPLENVYFEKTDIKNRADLIIFVI